jgi:hypothetical protein
LQHTYRVPEGRKEYSQLLHWDMARPHQYKYPPASF